MQICPKPFQTDFAVFLVTGECLRDSSAPELMREYLHIIMREYLHIVFVTIVF